MLRKSHIACSQKSTCSQLLRTLPPPLSLCPSLPPGVGVQNTALGGIAQNWGGGERGRTALDSSRSFVGRGENSPFLQGALWSGTALAVGSE